MLKLSAPLRLLPLLFALSTIGCHAQSKTLGPVVAGQKLSSEEARRVEVMIRSRSQMPADYKILVGTPIASDIGGFEKLPVSYTSPDGAARTLEFLISNDGKTLAQMNRFDLTQDPKEKVSAADRPARGGAENAPVQIVAFDDLECPFCAKMHSQLFPALLNRYKDQVRIVYRDFPLSQHPWAMHAAVDSNCLAAQSATAYWNFVDYVHAHASEIAGSGNSVEKAKQALDKLTFDEGTKEKLAQPTLMACVSKQDTSKVDASLADAESDALHVDSTPTLFINGEKVEGVVPITTIYSAIDRALVAEGKTPPPPVPAEKPATAAPATPATSAPAPAGATSPATAAPATKPGS